MKRSSSQEIHALVNVNAIAWGDWNSDGDLDLAVGGAVNPTLGIYADVGGSAGTPLVFVDRPGRTSQAYFYSAAEVLGRPPQPNIEFGYALLGSVRLCFKPANESSFSNG